MDRGAASTLYPLTHGGRRLRIASRSVGSRYLGALAYRDYRTLWLASATGQASAWALIVARGWLVLDLSHSSGLVGVVTFAAMLPLLVVPPFAGLLADRVDRRAILAYSFGVNLAHNVALAALALSGNIQVWHLVVLSLVNGTARAFQMPAVQSLVPNLVPRERLLNALALESATLHGSRLVGPGIIAPLMATAGAAGAFMVCTALYAVGLLLVLRIRTASTGAMVPGQGAVGNLLAGLRYVYGTPVVLSLIGLVAFHCALTMSYESLLPVVSKERLGAGGAGVSYLMMAVGAGALAMSVAVAGLEREQARGRLLLATGLASAVSPLLMGLATTLPLGLAAAAALGAAGAGFMTLAATMVQSVVPDAVRGRVSSIYLVHAGGVMSFGNLVNGGLADAFGPGPVLAVAGGAFLAVVAVSVAWPTWRAVYRPGAAASAPA